MSNLLSSDLLLKLSDLLLQDDDLLIGLFQNGLEILVLLGQARDVGFVGFQLESVELTVESLFLLSELLNESLVLKELLPKLLAILDIEVILLLLLR